MLVPAIKDVVFFSPLHHSDFKESFLLVFNDRRVCFSNLGWLEVGLCFCPQIVVVWSLEFYFTQISLNISIGSRSSGCC